ncbi:hypothetical protein KAR91_34545 [Candidatus Pacearchaeota archaeon]|nr:hypothetical protein [Candidatus Pacearchaeota archaeon]
MPKYSIALTGMPGDTTRVVLSDAVDTLVANSLHEDANGVRAVGVFITVETDDCRFTVGPSGNNPTQGDTGLGHILYEGQSIRLTNPYQILTFEIINYSNGTDSVIQVTPEFEKKPAT